MPYFVYRQPADRKNLKQIEVYDKFRDAKDHARELRKAQEPGDSDTIRVIFAEDDHQAKILLRDAHKPASPLEEWEA
jgi:hypothetical protein